MSETAPKNLKIAHLADLHLGYRSYTKITSEGFNQREIDINQAFSEAVDKLINIKPDLVLLAGDIFHTIRPSNAVITFAFKQFRRLADQINAPIIMLAGNHDSPKRAESGSLLQLMQEIPRIFVADLRQESFVFKKYDLKVTCLPHTALENNQNTKIKADQNFRYNILLTHGQVGSDFMGEHGGANFNLDQVVIGEWDYIALGHVHVYQEVAQNVVYAGAIEHTSKNIWQEASFNKGFVVVTLPDQKRLFYSLTAPREVHILESIDARKLDPEEIMEQLQERVDKVPGGIAEKLIRVEIHNLSSTVNRALDYKKIKEWKNQALNFYLHRVPLSVSNQMVASAVKTTKSIEKELQEFCAQQNEFSNTPDAISDVIKKYMNRLNE